MRYSSTIIAVLINVLVQVLPYLGVTAGTEQITTTVQTLAAIGTGVWIWYNRLHLTRVSSTQESDVKVSGFKK